MGVALERCLAPASAAEVARWLEQALPAPRWRDGPPRSPRSRAARRMDRRPWAREEAGLYEPTWPDGGRVEPVGRLPGSANALLRREAARPVGPRGGRAGGGGDHRDAHPVTGGGSRRPPPQELPGRHSIACAHPRWPRGRSRPSRRASLDRPRRAPPRRRTLRPRATPRLRALPRRRRSRRLHAEAPRRRGPRIATRRFAWDDQGKEQHYAETVCRDGFAQPLTAVVLLTAAEVSPRSAAAADAERADEQQQCALGSRRGGRAATHRRATPGGARSPPSMFSPRVSGSRSQRLRGVDDRGGGGHPDGGPGRARRPRTAGCVLGARSRRSTASPSRKDPPTAGLGWTPALRTFQFESGAPRSGTGGARSRRREGRTITATLGQGRRLLQLQFVTPGVTASITVGGSSSLHRGPGPSAGSGVVALRRQDVPRAVDERRRGNALGELNTDTRARTVQGRSIVLKQRVLGPIRAAPWARSSLPHGLGRVSHLAAPVRAAPWPR